jgi:dihydroneopterin aldolase
MAFVEVRDLLVQSHIGCSEDEQKQVQNLHLHIKAHFDPRACYKSDQLADTVDYMALSQHAQAQAIEKPRFLLETLASDIAQACLKGDARIHQVDIHIEKFSTAQKARHVGFADTFQRK